MTETEIKLTLSEGDYWKVVNYFKSEMIDEIDQTNYFFDTAENTLRSNRIAARMRSIKSLHHPFKWVFTVKKSGKSWNGIVSRPEIEEDIPEEETKQIFQHPSKLCSHVPPAIKNELKDFSTLKYLIIGDFRTIRRVLPFHGFHIEADENFLPNGDKYFEIEVETEKPDEDKLILEQKLNEIGAKYTNSPYGKFARLIMLPESQRFSQKYSTK